MMSLPVRCTRHQYGCLPRTVARRGAFPEAV